MKTIVILLTMLVLSAKTGSIMEYERTRFDHSSRANKFTITFSLTTALDVRGELQITMPPPGMSAFTTSTPCIWTQGTDSGFCLITTDISNIYTVQFLDSAELVASRVRVPLYAGKAYSVTFTIPSQMTQVGIWGPISLKTTTGGGDGNDIDQNPTFGMYAIGGIGLIATPLTVTAAEEEVINGYGLSRTITISVTNLGATSLRAPWKMKFSINNNYKFQGACSNLLYGKTTDAVDILLASADYTCFFTAGEEEGFIIINKDMVGGNSTWKMSWDIGVTNPYEPQTSSKIEIWLMDKMSSYTPYFGSITTNVLATPKEMGAITTTVMWGVTPDANNGFGFYQTQSSCSLNQGSNLNSALCGVLNSVGLKITQVKALQGVETVEVMVYGPSHIQIAASTIETNVLSKTELHPKCTNVVNKFTCTDLKDLLANQVINFWFKFAFQENSGITGNIKFKNAAGVTLSEYTMSAITPVQQDVSTQVTQESQQFVQTWDTTSMNNDCGPKLRTNVASEIKFKTKSTIFDYSADMQVSYTFTISDQLGWIGISTTATTNIVSPTTAGVDCFAQLTYSNPVITNSSSSGSTSVSTTISSTKGFSAHAAGEQTCWTDQYYGFNGWVPQSGKFNSRSPRPDASGKVHVYDVMVTVSKIVGATTTIVSRFLDNTMIVSDASSIFAATISGDIAGTSCLLTQQSASFKGTTWVGFSNTLEANSGTTSQLNSPSYYGLSLNLKNGITKYGFPLNVGSPFYKQTSSNQIYCTAVQQSNATASTNVKCYFYGGDATWGTAKKATNSAGGGFILLEVTAPSTGIIQVMVPMTFSAQTYQNYGFENDYQYLFEMTDHNIVTSVSTFIGGDRSDLANTNVLTSKAAYVQGSSGSTTAKVNTLASNQMKLTTSTDTYGKIAASVTQTIDISQDSWMTNSGDNSESNALGGITTCGVEWSNTNIVFPKNCDSVKTLTSSGNCFWCWEGVAWTSHSNLLNAVDLPSSPSKDAIVKSYWTKSDGGTEVSMSGTLIQSVGTVTTCSVSGSPIFSNQTAQQLKFSFTTEYGVKISQNNWLEITLGVSSQITKDSGLTGVQCVWGASAACEWSVSGTQLKIINTAATTDIYVQSGATATLYGVKTLSSGTLTNTIDCKISGAGGDIAAKADTFTYISLDTSATSTRKLVLGGLKTTFYFVNGKGTLFFTSQYSDKLDATSKITYELAADYGSDFVCSVTINSQVAWNVKSCQKSGTSIILEFSKTIEAATILQITLENVIWPSISATTLISATVIRYGGITSYVVPTADKLGFQTFPVPATVMAAVLTKKYNSVYADSEWSFTITPSTGTEFSSNNFIYINVPQVYNPEVGRLKCEVGTVVVPCKTYKSYWVRVTGPAAATGLNTEFIMKVSGIVQSKYSSAGKIYIGMSTGNNEDISSNVNLIDDKVLTAHSYTKSNYIYNFDISNLNAFDTATISFKIGFQETASPGSIIRIQFPDWWADDVLLPFSAVVKKYDNTQDGSCTDCLNIVSSIIVAGRSMTIVMNTSMLVNNEYLVTMSNVLTPGATMQGNQQWTILTGTDTSFTTINNLGLSQNTFEFTGFNLNAGKQVINSYDVDGKSEKNFVVYRQVYSTMICFGVQRGFRSTGTISLANENFLTRPSTIPIRSGSVPTENCLSLASKGTTVPGIYQVQFSFTNDASDQYGDTYTKMPFINIDVTADKFPLTIPLFTPCPAGNAGVPIFISLVNSRGYSGIPVTDVSVGFAVKTDEVHGDKAIVDADSVSFAFTSSKPAHFFGFTCTTGIVDGQTKLIFTLAGTDSEHYSLSNTEVTISPITDLPAVGKSVAQIDLTTNAQLQTPLWAAGDLSCPSIGRFFMHFHSKGTTSIDKSTAQSKTLAWYSSFISDFEGKSIIDFYIAGSVYSNSPITFKFATQPQTYSEITLICLDTNGGDSQSTANYLSGSNNAAIVKFNIAFTNPISSDSKISSTEADTILCLLCGLLPAQTHALSSSTGQQCGKTYEFNTGSRRILQTDETNTTSNATSPSGYVLEVFLQKNTNVEDATAHNANIFAYIASELFKTQLSAVTVDLSVGDATSITVPAVVSSSSVSFASTGTPTATVSGTSITITAGLNETGRIYFLLDTGSGRRVLPAVLNTSEDNPTGVQTMVGTTDQIYSPLQILAKTPKVVEVTSASGAVATGTVTFSGLTAGSTYKWWCVGGNNNPNFETAQYTSVERGSTAIPKEAVKPPTDTNNTTPVVTSGINLITKISLTLSILMTIFLL